MRPTVRSRRLGAQLRGYREQAHFDQTRVVGTIGIKQAQMSSIENGRTKISAEKLATLVAALRIPAEVAARMEDLRARAHVPGWWQDYGDILSEPIQALIELEEDASWIRSFDGQVIKGLLQLREYAEQIITASAPHLRVGDIDRYLELRMRRQQCLTRGIRLTAIMSEAAVRQQIGGPARPTPKRCMWTVRPRGWYTRATARSGSTIMPSPRSRARRSRHRTPSN